MVLELRQYRYFVAVCEDGQMTRAAARLNLAQPALSQAIAQLESQVGVKLLERRARGVEPTPAGTAFLAKAQAVLAAADDAEATAGGLARGQRGQLRIGFLSLTSPGMAGDLFAAFAARHPEVRLEWRELGFPSEDRSAWLDGVDIALTYAVPPEAGLEVLTLREDPLVAVMAAHHPLAHRKSANVGEVLDHTFVQMPSTAASDWLGFWRLDAYRTEPARVAAEVANTPQEAAAQVASGRAITTTPAPVAAQFAQLGIVGVPLHDAAPARLALVWRSDQANELVDVLVAVARETRR